MAVRKAYREVYQEEDGFGRIFTGSSITSIGVEQLLMRII
jgi:hypothetical protein